MIYGAQSLKNVFASDDVSSCSHDLSAFMLNNLPDVVQSALGWSIITIKLGPLRVADALYMFGCVFHRLIRERWSVCNKFHFLSMLHLPRCLYVPIYIYTKYYTRIKRMRASARYVLRVCGFFGYDAVDVVAVRGQPMLWIVDDLWLLFFVYYWSIVEINCLKCIWKRRCIWIGNVALKITY